jgi:broad specificity phosphatase PhoE
MGKSDSPLTGRGIEQARTTAEKLKEITFDAIFSSDSPRAQKTAEIIMRDRGLTIHTSEALREKGFGSFEGKLSSEYQEYFQDKLIERESLSDEAWWSFNVAPDHESYEDMVTRFMAELRKISAAHLGETVLVVSHGGCIRSFLGKLGYAPMKNLPPGSFNNAGHVVTLSDGKTFLLKEVVGVNKINVPFR